MPAILSGRYPSTIAWGSPQVHWPPQVLPQTRLISEMLSERGYHTTALLSYHYFEPAWGCRAALPTTTPTSWSCTRWAATQRPPAEARRASSPIWRWPSCRRCRRADDRSSWVHYYDPHFRYEPHPLAPARRRSGTPSPINTTKRSATPTATSVACSMPCAKVRRGARRRCWSPPITARASGEHAIPADRRHGYHLYANQTRVPLIVRQAGLRAAFPTAPHRVASPVGHVDVVPTILHSVLRSPPSASEKQLLGQSLAAAPGVSDAGPPSGDGERVVFQEVMYEGPTVRKALITPRWHLIQNLIPDGTVELLRPKERRTKRRRIARLRPASRARDANFWLACRPGSTTARYRPTSRHASKSLSPTRPHRWPSRCRHASATAWKSSAVSSPRARYGAVHPSRARWSSGCAVASRLGIACSCTCAVRAAFVNADHDFLDGIVPAQHLPVGRFVRDEATIAIPMWFLPGPAQLQVGLFQRNERLPVHGPAQQTLARDRAVVAATLQVEG